MQTPCRNAHAKAVAEGRLKAMPILAVRRLVWQGRARFPLTSASLSPVAWRLQIGRASRQEQAIVCGCPCAMPSTGNADCWERERCLGCTARAGASRAVWRPAVFCLRSGLAPARCWLSGSSRRASVCSQPSEAGRSPPFEDAGWWQLLCRGAPPVALGGHSKRPPSLTERRSDCLMLSCEMLRRCRRR